MGGNRERFPWKRWETTDRRKKGNRERFPWEAGSYYYPGFAGEGADLGGEGVEVVETAVVAVGGHSGDGTHGIEIPRGQYQQATSGTGLETLTLGFPIGADGLFLQMYQRIALLQAFFFHQELAPRDAGCDDDRLSAENGGQPLVVLGGVVVGVLVGEAADRMAPVALHLKLASPTQEEGVAENAVAALAYHDMEAALHHVGQPSTQEGAARVVVHIGYHRLAVAVVEADGIVVVVVEKRALASADKRVVLLALLFGEAADEGAFVVMEEGFLAQPLGAVRALAIDRNRSIGGRGEALLLLPSAGTGGLESLDDIAKAPLHGFEHLYHTMEMVGHTDTGMYHYPVAV